MGKIFFDGQSTQQEAKVCSRGKQLPKQEKPEDNTGCENTKNTLHHHISTHTIYRRTKTILCGGIFVVFAVIVSPLYATHTPSRHSIQGLIQRSTAHQSYTAHTPNDHSSLLAFLSIGIPTTYATETSSPFQVIPTPQKSSEENGNIVQTVSQGESGQPGSVWDRYNKQSKALEKDDDLGSQFATGIFSRNSILLYVSYVIKLISQLGLFIGAAMILYSGYQYAYAVFTGKAPGTGLIKNAIIGIIIITFAYAIIRILSSAFL